MLPVSHPPVIAREGLPRVPRVDTAFHVIETNLHELIIANDVVDAYYGWITIARGSVSNTQSLLLRDVSCQLNDDRVSRTDNCIGQHNQPHFIRFLLYTTLASSSCVILIISRLGGLVRQVYVHGGPTHPPTLTEILFMAVNLGIMVPASSILVLLLYQQIHNLLQNLTTIEYVQMKDDAIGFYTPVNVYDMGTRRNVYSVLGRNPRRWLFFQKPPGDGYTFAVDPERE
ncbi:Palmitoyltransferase [Thoreauomyces humboldtii]|nr:Palmitoyltransferase [Thoreauomyces humboldtii]